MATQRGHHVAVISRARGGQPRVVFHARASSEQSGRDLKRLLERSPATSYRASALLDRSSYHLLLVEAPDVRPDELRAAVRWRIKDLIGFHVDDAVIDVFEIPDQRHAHRNRMMYAIAARATRVSELANLLESAGLDADVVDIPEMAVRNLAMLLPEERDGLAFVHLNDDGGIITISRQGTLYLTRRLDLGSRALMGADVSAACDSVLLEVQRSLDYYDSHFSHGPVAAVALSPTAAATALADYLPQQLEVAVLAPPVEELLTFDEPIAGLDGDDLLAIGAALRQEARSL